MQDGMGQAHSRRGLLKAAVVAGSVLVVPGCARRIIPVASVPAPPAPVPVAAPSPVVVAAQPATPLGVREALFRRALAAMDGHSGRGVHRDRIAIADFAAPSSAPRFHLINLLDGSTTSMLVSHGKGSDPRHTGYVQRFSNVNGSEATCEGSFLTSDYYVGQHGRSQRLIGLDPTNNNALERAIVIHGAWYANQDVAAQHGKLGRSQGCFAVGERSLPTLFEALGEGRMIYAAKV